MRGLVPFEDFREVIRDTDEYYSEGTVHLLNSAKNPNIRFTFKKLMPIALDGFEMSSTLNDAEQVSVSATFVYESFDIEKVT